MPEPTERPAPPTDRRDRRVYVWWTVGLVFLALLGLFCWEILRPFLSARHAVGLLSHNYHSGMVHVTDEQIESAMASLGGPERAAKCLGVYVGLPRWAATDKEVAYLLLQVCGEPAIPILLRSLRNSDPEERMWAAERLNDEETATPQVVAALAAATGDHVPSVRRRAAYSLGTIGPKAKDAVPALIAMLERPEARDCEAATRALGAIGPEARTAVPLLIQLYGNGYARFSGYALRGLEGMGAEAAAVVPALLAKVEEAQKDGHIGWRIREIEVLGAIGPPAKDAVPVLRKALKDEDGKVRRTSVETLERIGPDARAAIPELLDALGDSDGLVCISAADALGRLGQGNAQVLATLADLNKKGDSYLRLHAAAALLRLSPGHREALATLNDAMLDQDEGVRLSAVVRLGDVGPGAAGTVPGLIKALDERTYDARYWAAVALGNIGPTARQAIPALERACDDPAKDIRAVAAEALKKIRGEPTK